MYCVISLENLKGLVTKNDDSIVKYVKNISAPIKLNFV